MNLQTLLRVSRPRFWLYLAGPYIVGLTAGADTATALLEWKYILFFLYFLLPANMLLYGVNDWFDADTDALNTKKGEREHLLQKRERRMLRSVLLLCGCISLAFYLLVDTALERIVFLLFLILAFAYSAPPLRFKARPAIDSVSNVLYILPGLLGYLQTSNAMPITSILLAAWYWAVAMHLYSAVPDIQSDAEAKLQTTAVSIGATWSLLLCALLWGIAALTVLQQVSLLLGLVGLVYPILALYSLWNKKKLTHIYWWFPFINGMYGFALFVYALPI